MIQQSEKKTCTHKGERKSGQKTDREKHTQTKRETHIERER